MISNTIKEILNKLRVCRDGVLPLLSAICDKIELSHQIDRKIVCDQNSRIVSTGTAIKAIVMNIVADRKALYKDVNKRVYQRSDININYCDENLGLTNLQLMREGRAPIGGDGNHMLFDI